MTKRQADRLRSIALSGLERQGFWIKNSADQIGSYARMLLWRPEYETKGEAALEDAEIALVEALEKVRAARTQFAALQVEPRDDQEKTGL